NKAAREMAERVAKLLAVSSGQGVGSGDHPLHSTLHTPEPMRYLGTFHSIAAKILRRHAEKIGLTSSFTILDSDDQLRLIKTLLQERNIDPKQSPPKLFSATIQGWKDKGLTSDK